MEFRFFFVLEFFTNMFCKNAFMSKLSMRQRWFSKISCSFSHRTCVQSVL